MAGAAHLLWLPRALVQVGGGRFGPSLGDEHHPSEKDGPTSAFHSCIPTGMHGPTRIFWASLTPLSLAERRGVALHLPADGALRPAGGRLALLQPHGLRSLNLKFTGLTQNLGHL